MWVGVDVGGQRKGFDLAVVDEHTLLDLKSRLTCDQVVEAVVATAPSVVAIDSPRRSAADGQTSRDCERELNRIVCGIRWTPDPTRIRASAYYAWIVEGLALFEALADSDAEVIEVFPTASWTRWNAKRGARSRSDWSRSVLQAIELNDVPARTNQDQRDAIAAALTARQHTFGLTQTIGEIVVPVGPW